MPSECEGLYLSFKAASDPAFTNHSGFDVKVFIDPAWISTLNRLCYLAPDAFVASNGRFVPSALAGLFFLLCETLFTQQRVDFLSTPDVVVDCAILRPTYSRKLNLLTAQLRGIHGFAQNFHR